MIINGGNLYSGIDTDDRQIYIAIASLMAEGDTESVVQCLIFLIPISIRI